MVQPVQNPFCEKEADACGALVQPAVPAGEAPVKHPGQVFGQDADARVLDEKSLPLRESDANASPGGVLDGVGQELFQGKDQLLLVGEYR